MAYSEMPRKATHRQWPKGSLWRSIGACHLFPPPGCCLGHPDAECCLRWLPAYRKRTGRLSAIPWAGHPTDQSAHQVQCLATPEYALTGTRYADVHPILMCLGIAAGIFATYQRQPGRCLRRAGQLEPRPPDRPTHNRLISHSRCG